MGYKKATCLANLFFIVLAAVFIIMACNFPDSVVKLTVGPKYFPMGISILLIIASAVSTITTWRGEDDHRIEIPSLRNVLVVLLSCIVFTLLWKFLGMFYVFSFVFIGFLLYFLNPQPRGGKNLAKAVGMWLCMQLVVYFVFQRLMYFSF
jgi:putative tricarboxylic transport membrane protein